MPLACSIPTFISHHPPSAQASGDGVFPAAWSCADFLNCGAGHGAALTCPRGTLWDATLQTCNHAAQVDCGGRPRAAAPEATTPAPTETLLQPPELEELTPAETPGMQAYDAAAFCQVRWGAGPV